MSHWSSRILYYRHNGDGTDRKQELSYSAEKGTTMSDSLASALSDASLFYSLWKEEQISSVYLPYNELQNPSFRVKQIKTV